MSLISKASALIRQNAYAARGDDGSDEPMSSLPFSGQGSIDTLTTGSRAVGEGNGGKAPQVYKFGTSGYRTDNKDTGFTEPIVNQLTNAVADYVIEQMKQAGEVRPILIGYDRRAASSAFAPKVASWLKARGLTVYLVDKDTPIPVMGMAARYPRQFGIPFDKTAGSVYLGASHNPPSNAGFNFLTADGAVIPSSESKKLETLQAKPAHLKLDGEKGGIETLYPYEAYHKHLKDELKIDFDAIRNSKLNIFYDPLHATGRHYYPRLLKDEGIEPVVLHGEDTPGPNWGGSPNPTEDVLKELSRLMQSYSADPSSKLRIGQAHDGDADRFALLDENGRFIHPNDVLALVASHLVKHRDMPKNSVLVRSQATTHLLDDIAKQQGWKTVQTPVGYKYIAEEFIDREKQDHPPVALGGESSGGLSIHGHIPEKDGLVANLLVAEHVAKEKRPVSQIIEDIKAALPNQYAFKEWSEQTDKGSDMMSYFDQLFEKGGSFAGQAIDIAKTRSAAESLQRHYGTRDGVKLYLQDGSWILFRKSGTEPLVRFCLEAVAPSREEAEQKRQLLTEDLHQRMMKAFGLGASPVGAVH